jgi:hypothetical protein
MFNRTALLAVTLMLVLLATGACDGKSSPEELTSTAPYEIGITAGNFLPGTELQYRGITDGMAEVYIKGKRALKQKADSLSWEGQVREGVSLDLDLRVLWFDESTLHVGGSSGVRPARDNSLDVRQRAGGLYGAEKRGYPWHAADLRGQDRRRG